RRHTRSKRDWSSDVCSSDLDTLMDHFGKPAPATGFAFVVDRLMSALSRQKIEIDTHIPRALIIYRASQAEKAIAKARELRREGRSEERRVGKECRWERTRES